jgi:hypothetical protein
MFPSIAYEYFRRRRARGQRVWSWPILSLVAAPLGVAVYIAINYAVYGDPLKFLYWQHTNWHMDYAPFTHGIYNALDIGQVQGWSDFLTGKGSHAIAIITAALACAAAAVMMPVSYVLFLLGNFWQITSVSFTRSSPRYVSALFPIYQMIGERVAGRRVLIAAAGVVCIGLQIFLTYIYTREGWVA